MALDRALGLLLLVGGGGAAAWLAYKGAAGGAITAPASLAPASSAPPVPASSSSAPANAPRGIRNNNPGNLRPVLGLIPWQGQVAVSDGYSVFSSAVYGIRGIFRNLASYATLHGVKTIRQIGDRWAPKGDGNSPAAWSANVAGGAGIPQDQPLNFDDAATMAKVARGIVVAENGPSWAGYYSPQVIAQAWSIR